MTAHDSDENRGSGIDRRTVLKSAAAASAAGLVGIPAFSGSAAAQSSETLYLTDSGGDNGFSSTGTKLYEVNLVTENSTDKAKLSLLDERTSSDFDQVDAVAATPDGEIVYYVDKNSERLGKYDVESDTFSNEGSIAGLPEDSVVLATYSPSGTFYVAEQSGNGLYTIDPSGPSATFVATITVDVAGADIAFDQSGTLYLFSSSSGKLYTVDPNTGDATEVGSGQANKGFYTGLAVREDGAGDLVGSSTSDDTVYVVDKATGSEGTGYRMYESGSPYDYGFGDMTVGALEPECITCESDDLLAKYEFECVETKFNEDDEEICVDYDFVFEKGDESLVGYTEDSYESKDGEDFEPVSATFGTEYCSVWQVVKAGQDFVVQELNASEGEVTATNGDSKHAISFVAFFCTEAAADDFVDSFPSNGRGGKPNRD